MRRTITTLLVAAWAGFGLACGSDDGEKSCNGSGGDNKLEGSYCSDVDMLFTEVQIRLQASGALRFLFVEYVRQFDEGVEKTLSIGFDTNQVQVQAGQPVDFLPANGSVRRILLEGSQNLTNDLEATSRITFDTYQNGEIGTSIDGQFNFLFTSGRVLAGEFEGTIIDATPTGSLAD